MQQEHTRRQCLRLIAAAAGAAAGVCARAADVRPWAGPVPPPREALDLQGRPRPVPPPGRPALVNFWATWCPPCRHEMPGLQVLAELYGERLAVQAVNFKEHPRTVTRFATAAGIELPFLLDPAGELARLWEVKVFPTTVAFGADGRPRWRVLGELDWTGPEAQRLVEQLLAGSR